MKKAIYYVHALTAVHVGTGQGVGAIDLPMARERATNLPLLPGSGTKGVLRDEHLGIDPRKHAALFGPNAEADDRAEGALIFGDALLLCLPVRSLYGTFAWVTCPFVLRRYARDHAEVFSQVPAEVCGPTDEKHILCQNAIAPDETAALDELDLKTDGDVARSEKLGRWANHIAGRFFPNSNQNKVEKLNGEWQDLFRERFTIVADSVFAFLAETALELRARVKLNDKKVVEAGPWYEENLPPETLLWGALSLQPKKVGGTYLTWADFSASSNTLTVQVGGKATVGRGRVRWLSYSPPDQE